MAIGRKYRLEIRAHSLDIFDTPPCDISATASKIYRLISCLSCFLHCKFDGRPHHAVNPPSSSPPLPLPHPEPLNHTEEDTTHSPYCFREVSRFSFQIPVLLLHGGSEVGNDAGNCYCK